MGREKEHLAILDYSEYPGPRYDSQGPDSGEKFYVKLLNPSFLRCFREDKDLIVDLDGTAGYASSFLDEAFGQLTYDFGADRVKDRVSIQSLDEPEWRSMINDETIPQWEKRRNDHQAPKATMEYTVIHLNESGLEETRSGL